jgi:hypothetical protein
MHGRVGLVLMGQEPHARGQRPYGTMHPINSDRFVFGVTCTMRSANLASLRCKAIRLYKGVRRCQFFVRQKFARSRCLVSEASFLRSSFTTQTGEVLSVHTLHHRHHTVVLSIPSTTPPYLAGPGRRSRWCAVRVHLSEAPPLAA